MDDILDDEIRQDFLDEALQCIGECEDAFLKLEENPSAPELLDQICRLAHNLKGGAHATGFTGLADLTHEMENFILKIKEDSNLAGKAALDILFQCVDIIKKSIPSLLGDPTSQFGSESLISKLKDLEGLKEPAPEEKVIESGQSDVVAVPSKESAASIVTQRTHEDESIRVKLSRLDLLNNFVGELVVLQGMLAQQIDSNTKPMIKQLLDQFTKLSKEIHEVSMSLRMVPIQSTLKRMQRVVRDTASSTGKEVSYHTSGEGTEVDKTVIESLVDPLTHMVRNAIDHGLENPNDRVATGKKASGRLDINCFHEGNNLVLEVIDDGKGIDPNIIRQKAVEKNIISESDALTHSQSLDLIFHPGFSTKTEVSSISGRGVGMDVVKSNIVALGGSISISSEVGVGTIFRISLPLSVAVIDGMITEIGQQRYVLPTTQVLETLKVSLDELDYTRAMGATYDLRGEVVPVTLAHNAMNEVVLDVEDLTAIVTLVREKHHILLVDKIIGQQQVVVKPLGYEVPHGAGYIGSSILGDGLPALILDIQEFVDLWAPHAQRVFEKGVGNG